MNPSCLSPTALEISQMSSMQGMCISSWTDMWGLPRPCLKKVWVSSVPGVTAIVDIRLANLAQCTVPSIKYWI